MSKVLLCLSTFLFLSCFNKDNDRARTVDKVLHYTEKVEKHEGVLLGELDFETRPRSVLLTGNPDHRLTPIYKVFYNERTKSTYTGTTQFFEEYWNAQYSEENQWNKNFMPGFEVANGFYLVNISHHDRKTGKENAFFESPVYIRNLYYPSFSKDTLNGKPVLRNFYMVSVYDEDTNQDSIINTKDLRRLYSFDLQGKNKKPLIPLNYSALSSEYDPGNDLMYVFAKLDENENGQMDDPEAIHIFWIDMKNPNKNGVQYSGN